MNTTKLRARTLGLTLAAACVAALPVHAQDRAAQNRTPASKQENIGVLSGLAVGAAAAGPFGAIAGAAVGAFLGDKYHKKAVENATLSNDLSKSEAQRQELTKNIGNLNTQLQKSQASQFGAVLSKTDDLGTDISFRTNDASINASSMSPLLKLGALAAAMPDVKVRVAGYADPRGSDELNDKLSKDRADAVAAVLAQSGLSADQLIVEAHGKSASESCDGDVDGYAFDRRVTVRIERKGAQEVASR